MIKINGKKIDIKKFSNNETNMDDFAADMYLNNTVSVRFDSDADLIHLMFVKKHIDDKYPTGINKLEIKYFPYSRMDRTEGSKVFTLKYVAAFINSLKFDSVSIYEAHSNVTTALLDRVDNIDYSVAIAKTCIQEIDFDINKDFIVFPDEGARKRYKNYFKGFKIATCEKVRDFDTQEIISMALHVTGKFIPADSKCIIVDDLCSYGRTFVMAAKALKDCNAKEIYLCITHAEQGIFKGDIFRNSYIDKVYTTNSILDTEKVVYDKDDGESVYDVDKINIEKIF